MLRRENIDFCIRYLMAQNKVEAQIPEALSDKQQLLRALMNIWTPQPLSEEYLMAQDAELTMQLQDKGIVKTRNRLWQGDITRLKVDAIVNSTDCCGHGGMQPLHPGIDNTIFSAAGLQLRRECDKILQGSEIAVGSAIITPGYNLPAKNVIHTVGPTITTGTPSAGQKEQLACCYRSCLSLAREHNCHSIAFCCISTGNSRFPNRHAAEIAVRVCSEARIRVVFNVFNDTDYAIYSDLLG